MKLKLYTRNNTHTVRLLLSETQNLLSIGITKVQVKQFLISRSSHNHNHSNRKGYSMEYEQCFAENYTTRLDFPLSETLNLCLNSLVFAILVF